MRPKRLRSGKTWWRQRRAQGYPVLVARDTADVLGFASFGDFRPAWPGYRFTVEHSVYVRSDCQRAGTGTALMQLLLARATGLGKHAILGGIDAENATSIRFHERLGFEQVARFRQVGSAMTTISTMPPYHRWPATGVKTWA